MKTFARWLGALLLVATPMMVAIDFASANTELVPASRLVVPFVSATSTRPTFLLLTNASAKNLVGNTTTAGVDGSIHLEFYNKSCTRTDRFVHLSSNDTDQIDVVATDLNGAQTVGFVDIDVRADDAAASTSIQENALLGTVVITDTAADFALSYPMAASIGSARSGADNAIVTRDPASGFAVTWTGRYEAFPTTIMVPGYYAEGGTGGGAITESLLAIASPADGNWYGQVAGTTGFGEAPGQQLTTATALINMPLVSVYDGCEIPISRNVAGHYVSGSLVTLLSVQLNRDLSTPAPLGWTSGKCGNTFGGLDEVSGAPIGWINMPNISCVRSANANFAGITACVGAANAPTSTQAKIRGVVGVLFEVTQVTGALPRAGADVTRLWGDPSTIYNQTGCRTSDGGTTDVRFGAGSPIPTGCSYNMYPIQTTP
jgi:hypothetical protein